jgi:hypothetical protein
LNAVRGVAQRVSYYKGRNRSAQLENGDFSGAHDLTVSVPMETRLHEMTYGAAR